MNSVIFKKIFLLIFVFLPILTQAQNFDLGSWNIVHAKYSFNKKWSLFAEAQLRSLRFYHNFHYYEFKGGGTFKLNKSVSFAAGIGNFQTYKEGGNFVIPKNNNELRIWPQVTLFNYFNNFFIEHRYRMENRFTSNGFKLRYRYRLLLNYEFGKSKKEFKPFVLSAGTEIFFTDREPFFERNRVNINFNYKISKLLSLQLGYIHQLDFRINDEIGRDFFVLGVYLDLSPQKREMQLNNTDHNEN